MDAHEASNFVDRVRFLTGVLMKKEIENLREVIMNARMEDLHLQPWGVDLMLAAEALAAKAEVYQEFQVGQMAKDMIGMAAMAGDCHDRYLKG